MEKIKRFLYPIEEIRLAYPNSYYEDGFIFNDTEDDRDVVLEDAKEDIEAYYDGGEITIPHSSGNPELEEQKVVDGAIYIREVFQGDYGQAYDAIRVKI